MGWVVFIAAAALIADSGDASRLLDDGIRAYDAMELDAASAKLREARAAANDKQRAKVDMWLAVVELERGREAAARKHMKNAFAQNPRLDVPDHLSPRVHALADELRPASPPPRPAPRPAPRAKPRRTASRAPAPLLTLPLPAPAAPPAAVAPAVAASTVAPAPDPEPIPVIVPATPREPPVEAQPTVASHAADSTAPPVSDRPAAAPGGAAVSPFLMAGAGASAVAASALVGAVALGVLAKGAEGEANAATRAVDATERYQEATTASMVANGLFVTSALAGTAAGVCIGVWMSGTVME